MNETPVFKQTAREWKAKRDFTVMPAEYTDRYSPEVARQMGHEQGWRDRNNQIIAKLRLIEKPTKQVAALLAELEEEGTNG